MRDPVLPRAPVPAAQPRAAAPRRRRQPAAAARGGRAVGRAGAAGASRPSGCCGAAAAAAPTCAAPSWAAGSVSAPRAPGPPGAAHLPTWTAPRRWPRSAARDQIVLRAADRRGHAIAYVKARDGDPRPARRSSALTTPCSRSRRRTVISATREAANRLTNCDRANLGRISAAAHRQREAIAQLDLDRARPATAPGGRAAAGAIRSSSLAELGRAREPAADQVGGRPSHENSLFPLQNHKDPSIRG